VFAQGGVSRIGGAAYFEVVTDSEPYSESVRHLNHRHALRAIIDYLQRNAIINSLSDIEVVIHCIAHGGEMFRHTKLLHHEDAQRLHGISYLSPDLPANVVTLRAAMSQLSRAKHVGVFDTSFTALMPAEAAHYALPSIATQRFHIRRYGYQGILHQEAYLRASALLKRPRRVVSAHIGADVSITAIRDGVAVETSTGFTAAEGLPGLTRAGSIDPRIPLHFAAHLRLTPQQVDKLLNVKSGLASMTGKPSYDAIMAGARAKDKACIEALLHLSYRIAQSVAGMSAAIGGIDVIVFSGEGASWAVIEEVCSRLSHMGVKLGKRKAAGVISKPGSVKVVLVRIREDDALFNEAARFLG
jgi:acetate kinase